MIKKLIAVVLLLPLPAVAEHMDVIEFQLKGDCSFGEYMKLIEDFKKWSESYVYQTKIAMPVQSNNLVGMYWLGTSANAAAFGNAWDACRDAQSDPDSVPAKLQAKLSDCEDTLGRRGYDIY